MIQNTIKKIIKTYKFRYYPNKQLIKRNILLQRETPTESAYLIATPHLVSEKYLTHMFDQDSFSINNLFNSPHIKTINPMFHFIEPYKEQASEETFVAWLQLADKKLPKKTRIFLGHNDFHFVAKYNLFTRRDVFYLYFDEEHYSRTSINITKPLMQPHTTTLMALPVLISLGYKNIYIIDNTIVNDKKATAQYEFYKKIARKVNVNIYSI